jgi:hypothetical protein
MLAWAPMEGRTAGAERGCCLCGAATTAQAADGVFDSGLDVGTCSANR